MLSGTGYPSGENYSVGTGMELFFYPHAGTGGHYPSGTYPLPSLLLTIFWVASLLNAWFEITRIVQGSGVLDQWISCCIGQLAYFAFILFHYGFLNYDSFSAVSCYLYFQLITKLLTSMQAILLIHVPAKFRSFTIEGRSRLSNCSF
jgi:hypothetical protein